jgi:glutamyl-tRNA synthetase
MTGRFAPSPTGALHVGNLRTALVAWLFARSAGERFLVRMEDLDRANSSPAHEAGQLADLAALGLDWDGPVVRQSARFDRYDDAISRLTAAGLTYECFCTRREIREAVSAPHGAFPDGAYPGTCRGLTEEERARRRMERPPALRLRTDAPTIAFDDVLAGTVVGGVDDVVLRRNDGVPAYNLAVVVDDAAQAVTTVVRGDDLLDSTPRQIHLQRLLGLPLVSYVHVPLVTGVDRQRLAKRDQGAATAVTLGDLAARGVAPGDVLAGLAVSLGLTEPGEAVAAADLVERFDVARLRALGRAPIAIADLQRSWS